ncbi:RNA polymerase sigma factor [Prosthecobacter sp.]|uniref:RNA polymerase sigma factor n=1 Tax=Prosthecobacter sp. TaxID=1965333 RepID=UPI0037845649
MNLPESAPQLSHSGSLPAGNSGLFPVTMWSMIRAANHEEEALVGLERLARAYWRPLYVFARQRGATHDGASDEVQGFFEHLISSDMLKDVQRGDVRFRSFLLRCFTNWLHNEHHRAKAAKRGGGVAPLPLEELDSRLEEPALVEGQSPDKAFDRGWARALVDHAMRRLEKELEQRERSEFLLELRRRTFASDGAGPDWEEMASRHGMSHGAVRKAATDLRRRFGVLLRTEVRSIVTTDEEVDEELRYLVSLLSMAA